jgi:hypothetical protein
MADTLKRIVLARPVVGLPSPDDFRIEEAALPAVGENQCLIRVVYASVDPGTRSRLSGNASYAPPLKPGDVIDGFCIGEVVESRTPKAAPGDLVAFGGGWTSHALFPGRGFLQKIPRRGVPLSAWIGVLGVPGMTAWFGLTRVAGLKAGERVLVTSAAGPVGATAGQTARRLGAQTVVGIAGGAEKCAWLTEEAGFDAALDYKAEPDLAAAVARAMPEGIDILFDNVGPAMIDVALPQMRIGGRIVVSGQLADYNGPPTGLFNTAQFIARRLRMEGLVVFDDMKAFPEAQAALAGWIEAGGFAWREERFAGLESAPTAFCGLFSGAAFGRRIVEVSAPPAI